MLALALLRCSAEELWLIFLLVIQSASLEKVHVLASLTRGQQLLSAPELSRSGLICAQRFTNIRWKHRKPEGLQQFDTQSSCHQLEQAQFRSCNAHINAIRACKT